MGKREGGSGRPKFPASQDLAGCRNGKTRPAKGGEERGMNGWGEVQMTVDGARQGRAGWDVAARGRCYQSEMSE